MSAEGVLLAASDTDEEADDVKVGHVSTAIESGDSITISGKQHQKPTVIDQGDLDLDLSVGGMADGQEDEIVPPHECPVCLQSCIHPVQLPCQHIFCFLCVKGAANQSKRCALCRSEIPMDFFNKPTLLRKEDLIRELSIEEGYQWFYEGRNGWWQYDERTTQELEEKHKSGNKAFELLIAGFLYVIDLENMLQVRRNDPTRRRRVKRDLANTPKKGVAGLKMILPPESTDREGAYGGDSDNKQVVSSKPQSLSPPTNVLDNENNNDSSSVSAETDRDSLSTTDDMNSQMAALRLDSNRQPRRRRRGQRNVASDRSSSSHGPQSDSSQN